jgi:hypothetical protein
MSSRKTINEYLFYELGYDLEHPPSAVADDWPFELQTVGTIDSIQGQIEVFEFIADNERHFALLSRGGLESYPAAGMTRMDLQLQHDGAAWIACQDPIDLATSRLGDDSIPPATERQAVIEGLAANICVSPRILEGLYLCTRGTYLALVEDPHTGASVIVGSDFEPHTVGLLQASPWRRLALGVGEMLSEGTLE